MNLDKSPSALRTIGEVAQELDIATHVLRFWESKFKQIKPQKRRGRRYYRPEDVITIMQIRTLLYQQGYTIRGVQKYLADRKDNFMPDPAIEQNMIANVMNTEVNIPDLPARNITAQSETLLSSMEQNAHSDTLSEKHKNQLRDLYYNLQEFRRKLQHSY